MRRASLPASFPHRKATVEAQTVAAQPAASQQATAGSQTLSRGIRILEVLADHDGAMTLPELVAELGLHRSIVYRLLRTLEDHRLLLRDEQGLISLGPRLATLAAGVERDLQQAALPALRAAADELAATCFLVSHDQGEVTTLVSAPPHRSIIAVAQNPGTRHPLGVGAPGRAILSQIPASEWPADLDDSVREQTAAVLAEGFAASHNEVIPGLHSVAVPLQLAGRAPLALGVVCLAMAQPAESMARRLERASADIAAVLGT